VPERRADRLGLLCHPDGDGLAAHHRAAHGQDRGDHLEPQLPAAPAGGAPPLWRMEGFPDLVGAVRCRDPRVVCLVLLVPVSATLNWRPAMNITRVETIPIRVPIKPELAIKSGRGGSHSVSPFLLVRIETDDGA